MLEGQLASTSHYHEDVGGWEDKGRGVGGWGWLFTGDGNGDTCHKQKEAIGNRKTKRKQEVNVKGTRRIQERTRRKQEGSTNKKLEKAKREEQEGSRKKKENGGKKKELGD